MNDNAPGLSVTASPDPIIPDGLIKAISGVVPEGGALHEPEFAGNETRYVQECIDTGWVSSVGKFVDQFEEKLCEITGAQAAVATVNGTAALHAALHLAGVQPGDEVLTPAFGFVAVANAVSYCAAVPHFVDVSETTSESIRRPWVRIWKIPSNCRRDRRSTVIRDGPSPRCWSPTFLGIRPKWENCWISQRVTTCRSSKTPPNPRRP